MDIVKRSSEKKFYFVKLFLCLFLSLIFIEGVFKVLTFKNLFTIEFIRIILFSLTLSAIIAFICTFFKPIISKIVILLVVFIAGIYAILQLDFKSFMGNYMSLNAAGDGAGRITEQINQFLSYIKPSYYIALVPFVVLLILFIFSKKFLIYEKNNYKKVLAMFFFIITLHLLSISTLYINFFQNPTQIQTNKTLYYKPLLLELSLKQFGTMRFLWRDIVYMINPSEEEIITVDKGQKNETPPPEPNYARNIDDSEWLELIENEKDSVIKNLHEFYINQNITPKNEMTGKFKDKNLILIMVEALDMIAINEELTPTLYKLSKEGWYFDNYYTPKYSCTTGESEYIGLTSIIPSSTVCTPNAYTNNNYSTSIFQLFKSGSYYNTSYHNYSDKFYNRTDLHQNMGSIKFYNNDDLKIKPIYGWPSDLNLMEEAIPHFIDEDKFFSFIITSTMHFPYNEDGHYGVVLDHWNKVKDLPYNVKIKRYMAKAIELDLGLEYLLKTLEESGKLDDTVIAIFGDHHPLNMEYKYLNEASPIDRLADFNIDKLPFIIYNSEMETQTISKTASTFDILPTLANLFDLDYDPRYYVGKDVFSEEETTVIFTNGSWITDKAMYFSATGKYKKLDDTVDDDYISTINQRVNNYFNVANKTLTKDYFKYRFAK
jgi:phosphoglycerol transferase MdoB-like AlkP superfamily enzyme